jgi:hypothetical protein
MPERCPRDHPHLYSFFKHENAVWIFQAKSVVLLVCGAAAFVGLFRILAACSADWPFDIGTSVSPLFAIVGYVHLFINSKSPTFATDSLLFLIWGAKA